MMGHNWSRIDHLGGIIDKTQVASSAKKSAQETKAYEKLTEKCSGRLRFSSLNRPKPTDILDKKKTKNRKRTRRSKKHNKTKLDKTNERMNSYNRSRPIRFRQEARLADGAGERQ